MPSPRAWFLSLAVLGSLSLLAGTVDAPAASPTVAADPPPPPAATAITLAASTSSTSYEKRVLALINKARSTKRKCGNKTYAKAKALKWNSKLALAAERHSVDMSKRNYFSHTGKNGKSAGSRIKATGYKYKAMGETLGAGYATPEAVVKAWLKSAGHCKVLMSKSYTQVGIGYYKGTGRYTHYITADFAKPK